MKKASGAVLVAMVIIIAVIGNAIWNKRVDDRIRKVQNSIVSTTTIPVKEEPQVVKDKGTTTAISDIKKDTPKGQEIKKPGQIVGSTINESNVFNAVNQERYKIGVTILERDARLDTAAEAKLKDMLEKKYFSHYGPDGKAWSYWISQTGFNYSYNGENLAGPLLNDDGSESSYYETIQDLTTAWMNSLLHRENMLKAGYTKTGIAVSGHYVVQMFASEAK